VSEARNWLIVCDADAIEEEDVVRFDHGGATYAVYRTPSGFYASDGLCTHEWAHLADGFVIDEIIECPLHQGRFHIPTGKAKSPPVCIDLQTYPVRVQDGKVLIGLPG
jgi:3-phenylpropionate/trans-cinnamate dioxygenase ferredoxin component